MYSRKLKILMVNTVPTEENGITNVLLNYYNAIDKTKIEIDMVAINKVKDYYKDIFCLNGGTTYTIERKISHPIRYVAQLSKVCRNYDIVHANGNSATLILEMIAAKIAGVKVRIAHCHSTSCNYKLLDKVLRPFFHLFCNARIACSIASGKWLFGNRDFTVLKNAINTGKYQYDCEKSRDIRSNLNLDDDSIVIGHVGNFLPVKNHRFLLQIFYELLFIDNKYRLVLLGSGPLMEDTITFAKSLKISDKIYFVGSVNKPGDYMSAIDIIVMPSLYEGLPLTLIEEQANGLTALVSDTITTEIDLTGAVHFKSLGDNPKVWASELHHLLSSERKNRKYKSEIAIQAIKEAGFDLEHAAKQLEEFYMTNFSNKKTLP